MPRKTKGINKVKDVLISFGRILTQHKRITALCSVLLFGAAFVVIAGSHYKPSDAATNDSANIIRNLDTSALNISGYLQASSAELTAFDDKVNALGAGTSSNPVVISTKGDLLALAQRVNGGQDYYGKYFILGDDIDLQGNQPTHSRTAVTTATGADDYTVFGNISNVWTPIGNQQNKFRGNFDGNGKTISNITSAVLRKDGDTGVSLTFDLADDYNNFLNDVRVAGGIDEYLNANPQLGIPKSEAYAGLFGYIEDGTIQNLNMESPIAISQQFSSFNVVRSYLTATNPNRVTPMFYGFSQAGSVVGKTTGELQNITVADSVVLSGGINSFAGGVAGSVNSDNASVTGAVVSGRVVSANTANQTGTQVQPANPQSQQAGGLVGGLGVNSSSVTIQDSSLIGGEILSSQMAGGIAAAYFSANTGSSVVFNNLTLDSVDIQGGIHSGGIAATIGAPSILFEDVRVSGSLQGGYTVAGLAGNMVDAELTVKNANITTDRLYNVGIGGGREAGGFFGKMYTPVPAVVEYSSYKGNITSNGWIKGQLAGVMEGGGVQISHSDFEGDGACRIAQQFGLSGGISADYVTWNGSSDCGLMDNGGITTGLSITNSSLDGEMSGSGSSAIVNYFGIGSNSMIIDNFTMNMSGNIRGLFGNGGTTGDFRITNNTFECDMAPSAYGAVIGGYGVSGNILLDNVTWNGSRNGSLFGYGGSGNGFTIKNSTFEGDVINGTGILGGFSFGGTGILLDNLTWNSDIKGNYDAALFAYGSATYLNIKDSTFNSNITSERSNASLIQVSGHGYAYITLENIEYKGNIVSESGAAYGLFGNSSFGTVEMKINNSTFEGDVTGVGGASGLLPPYFGAVDISLDNVTRKGNITATNGGGGGFIGGSGAAFGVTNLTVKDSVFDGNITGTSQAGGLSSTGTFGADKVLLDNVTRKGSVTATNGSAAGGFTGTGTISDLAIINSTFDGDVNGTKSVGGIISDGFGASSILLNGVKIKGDITAQTGHVGGFAGSFGANDFSLLNSSYEGDIIVSENINGSIGGFIGTFGATTATFDNVTRKGNMIATNGVNDNLNSGGIFGAAYIDTIAADNIQVDGNVIGGWMVGGFAGNIAARTSASLSNSNFSGNVLQTYAGTKTRTPQGYALTEDGIVSSVTEYGQAGGVIGDIGGWWELSPLAEFNMENVVHRGDVGGINAGGLIGQIQAAKNVNIFRTAQVGNIVGRGYSAGGLVAAARIADIKESLAVGDVAAGDVNDLGYAYAGGIIGGNSSLQAVGIEYNISDTWFGGNVSAGKQTPFAFAGGLIGGVTDHIQYSNLGKVSIEDAYVVANTVANGGIYHGSVMGYSINEPKITDTYVDFQELTAPRYAIGNFQTVSNPVIGDESYFPGVTNLRTMQMTGDGKGVPGRIGERVWYKGIESSLRKDRAVDNMEFVETEPNDTWRVPPETALGQVDSISEDTQEQDTSFLKNTFNFGTSNAYAADTDPEMALFEIETFYPRLEWTDIGLQAQTRPIALLNIPKDSTSPDVPDTGIRQKIANGTVSIVMTLGVATVLALLRRVIRRKKNDSER